MNEIPIKAQIPMFVEQHGIHDQWKNFAQVIAQSLVGTPRFCKGYFAHMGVEDKLYFVAGIAAISDGQAFVNVRYAQRADKQKYPINRIVDEALFFTPMQGQTSDAQYICDNFQYVNHFFYKNELIQDYINTAKLRFNVQLRPN